MFSETGADTAIDRFNPLAKELKNIWKTLTSVLKQWKILDACHAIKFQVLRRLG